MATPFIAEIRIFSFSFPPRGWASANGQLLAIVQNQALFSLLGTTYGGNGQTTFALPDLRSRTPLHMGTLGTNTYTIGQPGGEEAHALTAAEMPAHNHAIAATTANAPPTAIGPENASPANAPHLPYRSGATQAVAMKAGLVQNVGGSQPHNNMQPYLALNFCIALQGIFPSRN